MTTCTLEAVALNPDLALYPELAVTRDSAYLNTGAAGPMPECAYQVLRRQIEHEHLRGRVEQDGKPRFFDALEGLRARAAALVGCADDELAVTGSTSEGVNVVLWGLGLERGDHVLTTAFEHKGATAGLAALCRVRGVEATFGDATSGDEDRRGAFDLDAFFAHLTPRTRLIMVSHVSWTSGLVVPLRALCERARALGVPVLVDGAQSVGAIPVDVREIGCDFYSFPSQKWLLGAEGVGYLYVARDRLDTVAQTFAGVFSYAVTDGRLAVEPQPGASRFEVGTRFRSLLAASAASLDWLRDAVGWESVWSGNLDAAARFTAALRTRTGLEPVPAGSATPEAPLVAFELPAPLDADEIVQRLDRRRIFVRTVPGPAASDRNRLRVSTAFFNTDRDFETLLDVIAHSLDT